METLILERNEKNQGKIYFKQPNKILNVLSYNYYSYYSLFKKNDTRSAAISHYAPNIFNFELNFENFL